MLQDINNRGNIFRPLSVGNVVSTAFMLYRFELKKYLQISLQAHLWLFIPIYGWAKYYALNGLISRLAFGKLINQPEKESAGFDYVNARKWSFLRVAFQIGILLVFISLGIFVLATIIVIGIGMIIQYSMSRTQGYIAAIILIVTLLIFGSLGAIWFSSRWFIAEVVLGVEQNINGSQSIGRSWDLTKNAIIRIQGVMLVGFIVSVPFLFFTNFFPQLFMIGVKPGSSIYWTIYSISLVIGLIGDWLITPFWQTIKAVIYYDLLTRREGLGLQLTIDN